MPPRTPDSEWFAPSEVRQVSGKLQPKGAGKGKGKAPKNAKKVTTNARSGAHKNVEPQPSVERRRLEMPQEGYWDENGAWVDPEAADPANLKELEEEAEEPELPTPVRRKAIPVRLTLSTQATQPTQKRPSPSLEPPTNAQREREREHCPSPEFSHELSPRSLAMFQEVELRKPEPLFAPSSDHSDLSDEEGFWAEAVGHLPPSDDHPQPSRTRRREDEEGDELESRHGASQCHGSRRSSDLQSTGHLSSSQHTRHPSTSQQRRHLSNHHHIASRSQSVRFNAPPRMILGELAIASPQPLDTRSPEPAPARRRNQTYSSRVRHTYRHATHQEPRLSQEMYNSYLDQQANPTHPPTPTSQQGPSRPTRPIWSRIPKEEENGDETPFLTPEPEAEDIRHRLRACTTQEELDDEYAEYETRQVERELEHSGRSESPTSDSDVKVRGHHERYDEYHDREDEPDFFGDDRLFAPGSLESRSQEPDYYGPKQVPLTTLRDAYTYHIPPPSARRRHLTQRVYYPNALPVILEEDEVPRLHLTQTRGEIRYGDAKNHKKVRKSPARRRRTQVGRPRQQIVDLPRPVDRITVPEFLEGYHFNPAKPFPVNSQLVRAGHRAALESRRATKPRGVNGGARGVRLPGDRPRIVHASDVPDEGIEPNTQSSAHASTQVPASPTQRFHHAAPERLRRQRLHQRGQAVNSATRGVVYPPLQFTNVDRPTRSTTHSSRHTDDMTNHGRRSNDSLQSRSRVPDSVRHSDTTSLSGQHRRGLTENSSQHLSSIQSMQPPPQTQYMTPPLDFWDGDADPVVSQEFEQEEARRDAPSPGSGDEIIEVVMDNGEVVRISRREADSFALTEVLIELAQPMTPEQHEDIEQFMDHEEAPPPPTQSPHPLTELDTPPGDQLSGLNLTARLLRMAERGPQAPAQKSARELKLEERRQRVKAKRREGGSSSSRHQSASRPSPSTSQRQPINRFSQPQPTPQPELMNPSQYPTWTDAPQLPGPVRTRLTQPESAPPQLSGGGPTRRSKSMGGSASAPFKRPTRVNATPPPEPTLAERIQASIANAVPAYGALKPKRRRSPPLPQLGSRVGTSSHGNPSTGSTQIPSRSRSVR